MTSGTVEDSNNIIYRLQLVEERAAKHHKDLYEGNGKPSLTNRMDSVERTMEARQKRDERMTTAIITLAFTMAGTFLTLLANLLLKHM